MPTIEEEEREYIPGYGTLKLNEPTTLCDIANTLGYIEKTTPVVEKIEQTLEKYNSYRGYYDENGRFTAGCLRSKHSYSTLTTPEKSDEWRARGTLRYQLWDAHVEYQNVCPSVSVELKQLHDEFEKETEEMSKRGEFK